MYGPPPRGRWRHGARPGDNGAVKASRPAWVIDTAIAAGGYAGGRLGGGRARVTTTARSSSTRAQRPHPAVPPGLSAWVVLGVALTTAPLAFRRRYPATAFGVIFAAVLVAHDHATTISFGAVIFAAYSAVLYSRFRWAALLAVGTGAVIATADVPGHHAAGPRPVHRAAGAGADRRRGGRDARVAAAGRGFGRTAAPGRGRARGADPPGGRGGAGPDRRRAARRRDPQRERDGGAGGRGPQRAGQLTGRGPGGPAGRRGQRADRDE